MYFAMKAFLPLRKYRPTLSQKLVLAECNDPFFLVSASLNNSQSMNLNEKRCQKVHDTIIRLAPRSLVVYGGQSGS